MYSSALLVAAMSSAVFASYQPAAVESSAINLTPSFYSGVDSSTSAVATTATVPDVYATTSAAAAAISSSSSIADAIDASSSAFDDEADCSIATSTISVTVTATVKSTLTLTSTSSTAAPTTDAPAPYLSSADVPAVDTTTSVVADPITVGSSLAPYPTSAIPNAVGTIAASGTVSVPGSYSSSTVTPYTGGAAGLSVGGAAALIAVLAML